MKINKLIISISVLLVACSPKYKMQSYEHASIAVDAAIDSTILQIITPYQDKIQDKMNEVLSYTKNNLEKGKPESTMGNFVTDLCLNYSDAHMCVMNNGGLRTTINKGNITRGKIYELMPFENELVVLELNKDEYIGLLKYIVSREGEPFSGIKISINEDKKILSNTWPVNFDIGENVKVLTSDYLANGGDAMHFFKGKKQYKVGIKLRDAILDYCIKTDTINVKTDNRIIILEDE